MNQSNNAHEIIDLSKAIACIASQFDISTTLASKLAQDWRISNSNLHWEVLRHLVLNGDILYGNRRLVSAPFSSDADLECLISQMRGPNGLNIKDRKHYLKSYPQCFIGTEAVQWLIQTQNISKVIALSIGKRLVRRKIIHHVLDQHDFKDEFLFYRFYKDEWEPNIF